MPNSMLSSSASSPCRLELRSSAWLQAALLALSLLAPLALWLSEAPAALAWPLGLAAMVWGLWTIRHERRRPVRTLLVPGDGPVRVDAEVVEDFALHWRGPIAFLSWRDAQGRIQRHALWPDTLPPPARRELRLAAGARRAGR